MRICLITSVPFPPEEGLGYHVWNLAKQLTLMGHEVGIITRGKPGPTHEERHDGISLWRASFAPFYPLHVHLHGLFVDRLLHRLEPRFDLVNAHTPLPPPVKTSLPLVTSVHSPMRSDTAHTRITNARSLALYLFTPFSVKIEHSLFNLSRCTTAVARWVADDLALYGMKPQEVELTGNGVESCFFDSPNGTHKESYILYVGRLDIGKGLEDLVQAARIIVQREPDLKPRFILAGKGPMESELKSMIARMGLEYFFELRGHIGSRHELVDLYSKAGIFVLPSHHEGMPTVLLEAMASGLPVVSTAVGGALEVISDRENGLLVPPGDPEALAEAILEMSQDENLRKRCQSSARQTVEERFSWEAVARRYLDVYQGALEAAG
jgi:glycosyltransferase involved in cell wall biosynthesis